MTLAPIKLIGPSQRAYATRIIADAPDGWIVTVKEPTRNLDQNARLWASLGDIADAKLEGRIWSPEVWKAAFMHARGHTVRFYEALDGAGMFPADNRSSRLTVRQMNDLITTVQEYGDRHDVQWSEPNPYDTHFAGAA